MTTYTIYSAERTDNGDTIKRMIAQTDDSSVADELVCRFSRIYRNVQKTSS